jgi:hypothetical protein
VFSFRLYEGMENKHDFWGDLFAENLIQL